MCIKKKSCSRLKNCLLYFIPEEMKKNIRKYYTTKFSFSHEMSLRRKKKHEFYKTIS